ncbi:MAG: imidazoleglycerol-phosphate dehydratase HisB [Clostridiales bacterium]|nr:imidazoleglycerol-phosphate dehydratase HisB [Clostridiales bacterium]
MRTAEINRKTAETDISLKLNLDGKGNGNIDTGCGFLNHMLTLFAKHGRFDLDVSCRGDVDVDFHHTTEDIGITLGQAFKDALGDKKGIVRYGSTILPMDEALILSAIDLSGRGFFVRELNIKAEKVGDFDTELLEEFFQAFAMNCGCTLHLRQLSGSNAHHILEGAFKSVARSLKAAVAIDAAFCDEIPSTKGVL